MRPCIGMRALNALHSALGSSSRVNTRVIPPRSSQPPLADRTTIKSAGAADDGNRRCVALIRPRGRLSVLWRTARACLVAGLVHRSRWSQLSW
jgi:hypothetical protein